MNLPFEVFIALRYLKAKSKQTFISLISLISMAGVGVGVCALVVVLSVMGGFQREFMSKIIGFDSHLIVMRLGLPIDRPKQVMELVDKIQGVEASTPFTYGQAMLIAGGGASGAVVRGIDTPAALRVVKLKEMLKQGSLDQLAGGRDRLPGVVIGAELARRLGVDVGSVLNLLNPLGQETPVGRVPKSQPFRVAGFYESGLAQFDATIVYIHLSVAQELFEMGGAVTGIEVNVKDPWKAGEVGRQVGRALGPGYYATDWMTRNQNLFAALKLERVTMFVILILIVLVAAFGVISSSIMLVMEKTKEIGVLMAMGCRRRSIWKIFVSQGLVIGLLGTFGGMASGLGICWLLSKYQFIELPKDIYPINTLPVEVDPVTVGLVGLSAVALCLLATLHPARMAARQDPVKALRYE